MSHGLVSWHRGRKVMRGDGLAWPGTGLVGVDQLIHINRLTRPADERDRRRATQLMWAAFLADLHAAFSTRRGRANWSLTTVVLLDDVDSRPGNTTSLSDRKQHLGTDSRTAGGRHAAQLRADEGENRPKVRLVLANPGNDQQAGREVTGQLTELADGEDRLVGMIGLVPSSGRTQEVMRRLAAADLPVLATLVTATDINEVPGESHYVEGFTRVGSTTRDQVAALSTRLGTARQRRAMLVYDRDEENLVVSAVRDDFKAVAPARANLSITVESEYDTEGSLNAQLKAIMGDLCGDGAPDPILYAARAELFDEPIVNVRERSCARDRLITVVWGSDVSQLSAQFGAAVLRGGRSR